MSIQAYIGLIYLFIVIALSVVFLLVWKGSKPKVDFERYHDRFSRIGTIWLVVLIAIGAMFTLATLPLIHYPGVAAPLSEQRQIVKVDAFQFGWVIEPKEIKAGTQVEFVVTSRDVNHDFGVFNANGVLLFQVQAMPKYTNRAVYTFDKPGTYKVICLEYCGLAHHVMMTTFEVVP
ncbi:MAG: cytochrome C oxidase subunit II [Chloroflexi bacterium]|nr:cytochrome C oxidase subunit II [Chloroflexota bacterium]